MQISTTTPTPYPVVIPDGSQAIFISLCSSKIGGAQSKACDIQILQPSDYFGIRFYPGALRYFFDLNLPDYPQLSAILLKIKKHSMGYKQQ